MTALKDAELAVAEARREVHEWLYPLTASTADEARAAVTRLEAAVRAHDAETVRELSRAGYSAQEAAKKIDPRETP